MLINISTKYIFKQILTPFFGGILFFSFILIMFQVFKLSDLVIIHGAPKFIIAKLLVYTSISFVPITFPIAYLLSVLSAFGRMSADSEIIAMRAIGLGVYELMIPPIALGVAISAMCLYSNYYLVPWGNLAFRETIIRLENTKAVSNISEGSFTPGFFDLLVFAEKVNSQNNTLKHVFIFDERDRKNTTTIIAKDGKVIPTSKEDSLSSSIIFRLQNGSIHKPKDRSSNYNMILFNTYDMYLKINEASVSDVSKPLTYDYTRLKMEMEMPGINRQREITLKTEYWKRLALSISPIFLGLMGIGLGSIKTRAVKSQAASFSLLVLLVYWILYIGGAQLSETEKMSPAFAMNLGNIVLFVTAIFAIRRSY